MLNREAGQAVSSFEVISSRLSAQYTQLMDILRNVKMLHERLYGPSPSDSANTLPTPNAVGAFNIVLQALEGNDRAIAQLTEAIAKLHRIA